MNNNSKNKKPIALIKNRKQKRDAEKILGVADKSIEELNQLIIVINAMNGFKTEGFTTEGLPKFKDCLLEGDKVKIVVDRIKKHQSWSTYQQGYRDFVEANDGVVMTVEYDKDHMDRPNLVSLVEDTTEPKWLFWDGDLDVLDERDGKFKPLYMVSEEE